MSEHHVLSLVGKEMAVTWEPLVRLISNLEKAHTQVPSVDCDVISNEEEEEL